MLFSIIYSLFLVVFLIRVITHKNTILVTGKGVFVFHVFFLFVALSSTIIFPLKNLIHTEGLMVLFFMSLVFFFLRNFWILINNDIANTKRVIKQSLKNLLFSYQFKHKPYRFITEDNKLSLTLYTIPLKSAILNLQIKESNKKVELLKKLLKKNFDGIFPRITIHT